MAVTLAQKLKIKEGNTLRTIYAPAGFEKKLGPLPSGASVVESGSSCQQVHWFVDNRAQMEKDLGRVLPLVKPGVICWVYYPKGSSRMQTDLTRDKGWEALLAHGDKYTWISLISFDDTWSAFGFRLKTEADNKKVSKPAERPILDYIDAKTKTIRLPDDLAAALAKKKKEKVFFDSLSFTNRKEYVEWVVTAKREVTRMERVKGTIERLGKEWKNPGNL